MKVSLSLMLLLLASCGELVSPETYQGNRNIGPWGGAISLDRLTVVIPRDVLDDEQIFRMEEVDDIGLPSGALGPAYEVLPEELPEALATAGLDVIYRIDIDELPPEVYFVELSIARLEHGAWIPLDAPELDPVAGEVRGVSHATGIFTVIQDDSPE